MIYPSDLNLVNHLYIALQLSINIKSQRSIIILFTCRRVGLGPWMWAAIGSSRHMSKLKKDSNMQKLPLADCLDTPKV